MTHRMSDPTTRVRTLIVTLALFGLSWSAITVLGERSCSAFSDRETRELAGLPVPPECVSARLEPDQFEPLTGVTR